MRRPCAPLDERLTSIMDDAMTGWHASATNAMKRACIANYKVTNEFALRRGRGKPAKSPELIFALAAALRDGGVTSEYHQGKLIDAYLRQYQFLPPLSRRPNGLLCGYEPNWQSIRGRINKHNHKQAQQGAEEVKR